MIGSGNRRLEVGGRWLVLFHKKSWHFSFRKTRIISYGHLELVFGLLFKNSHTPSGDFSSVP